MKHPHQIAHDAYLHDLELSARKHRTVRDQNDYGAGLARQLRAMSVVGLIVAIGAFVPWGAVFF